MTAASPASNENVPSRRACYTVALVLLLNVGFVSSFSTAHRRISVSISPKRVSYAHSDNVVAATLRTPSNSLFAHRATVPESMRVYSILSGLIRYIGGVKRSISRTFAILSFAFFSVTASPRSAVAWGKTAETEVTKVEAPTNANKRCLKCIVTVGAVAAGAATANKVRGPSPNTSDDYTGSPEEVSNEVNSQLRIVDEPPKSKPVITYRPAPGTPLVKDLESKIERLRESERLAVQHAADNIAKEEAAKSEQMAKDAALNQRNRVEERIAKIAEEEANRIAAADKEREEQSKLAKEKIAAVEKERLEYLSDQETNVDQTKIEKEMQHKVTQSPELPHADESRTLVTKKMSPEELQKSYAAMGSEERAFNILKDLGMVEVHPDEFEDMDDDNIDPVNVFL